MAEHALEVQGHVHAEPAMTIVPLPGLHPADERICIPLVEPVHEHPGALVEHEEVEVEALAKGPAEWFGTVRITYLTVNALRAVASLEFGPATAGRDAQRTA